MNIHLLEKQFLELFNKEAVHIYFAPGRINLIGEHVDYNGGHVLPCPITLGTYILVRKRNDRDCQFYSANFPDDGIIRFSLDDLSYDKNHRWANYPKGMIHHFIQEGFSIDSGIDALVYGNIPSGAGLSSSASLELATGYMLKEMFDLEIERIDMIKIGQRVENDYIGVNSGIMDQFAIGMGENGHGILLDCYTLDYQYIPIQMNDYRIIVMNTNKNRDLADSKYNERRFECDLALKELQKLTDISYLCELSPEQFELYQQEISDPITRKRARHVIHENERTLKAAKALEMGDWQRFGQLLKESHISLRDDYEVTGKELDTIVEAAWRQEGVIGARMTGAGFGGCAIAIVEKEKVAQFIENVKEIYQKEIGYLPSFYDVTIGGGLKKFMEFHNVKSL